MTDGLKAKHRAAIIDALAANDRVERAVLFGSRATETYTSASDVDIALFGDRLTLTDRARLDAVIESLTVPQRIDLLLHATIDSDALREHIERQGVEWYQRQESEGTELPGLSPQHRAVLEALTLALPPLPEQRAIAHVLAALDDKIELNRRMNETLEAMAQMIFRDWFVDFGPVRAKLAGRAYRLPEPLLSLFPDRLVDSDLGEIPEGWMPKRLGECFALTMGQSPPGNTYNDHGEGLPFFQGRTDFSFRYPENRKFCTEPTRIAKSGDALVSVRALVGDINMAWEKCCIGRGVAALRHKSGSISFTYYSVRSLQNSIGMHEHTGTVFGAINRKQFEAIRTLEPRSEVVETFDTLISPLDCRIRNNVVEIRALTDLRDTLLPKLVSGEVRLRDAERMVEMDMTDRPRRDIVR